MNVWRNGQVKLHLALATEQQAHLDWQEWGIGHGLLDKERIRQDPGIWLAMPEQTRLQQLQRRLKLNNAIDVLETMCIERYMEIQKCSKPQTGECSMRRMFPATNENDGHPQNLRLLRRRTFSYLPVYVTNPTEGWRLRSCFFDHSFPSDVVHMVFLH
jgi:hypothetical protein